MARQYFINGETMITVKGNATSLIATVQELGLSQDAISVTEDYNHDDIAVDAYGNTNGINPPDQQIFGAQVVVKMNLVHYDVLILQECVRLSMGNAPVEGQLSRAGTLMGGNQPLYGTANNFISVGISSPVGGIPWTFLSCYLFQRPVTYPLGTKRSIVDLLWRGIAYSVDPWNGGTGSQGVPLYTHNVLV